MRKDVFSEVLPTFAAPAAQRRGALRQRILKSAKIISLDHCSVVDCSLIDSSATGARIKCGDLAAVPNEFHLLMRGQETVRPCRVMWRRGDSIGVEFTGASLPAPKRKAAPTPSPG